MAPTLPTLRAPRETRRRSASVQSCRGSGSGAGNGAKIRAESARMNTAGRSALREGIVAGLIGAAVVAIWFFVFDILRGRPFLTPSLLGSLVFLGINTPVATSPAVGPILGYTVLHGL